MGMTNAQAATKWVETHGVGKSSNGNLNYSGHVIRSYTTPIAAIITCLLYTSPSPRDGLLSRMPSSA